MQRRLPIPDKNGGRLKNQHGRDQFQPHAHAANPLLEPSPQRADIRNATGVKQNGCSLLDRHSRATALTAALPLLHAVVGVGQRPSWQYRTSDFAKFAKSAPDANPIPPLSVGL